jgi:hypothetical protein
MSTTATAPEAERPACGGAGRRHAARRAPRWTAPRLRQVRQLLDTHALSDRFSPFLRGPCSSTCLPTSEPTLAAQVAVIPRVEFRTRSNATLASTSALTRHWVRLRQVAAQWHHPQDVSVTPRMGQMELVTRPASRDTTPATIGVSTPVTPTAIGRRAASRALRKSAMGTRTASQRGPRSRMAIPTSIVTRP